MKIDINITQLLGEKADFYLNHVCEKITKDELQTPSRTSLDKVFTQSTEIRRYCEAFRNCITTEILVVQAT